jgi:hypothetical protein
VALARVTIPFPAAGERFTIRNTKMKADHRRSQVEQQLGHRLLLKTQDRFPPASPVAAAKARK